MSGHALAVNGGLLLPWDAIHAVATVGAAVVGAIIAILLHRVESKSQALDAFDNYRREFLDFTKEVVATMSQVEVLIKTDPNKSPHPAEARQRFFEHRIALMSHLSSLIDRGRFFFPNHGSFYVGGDKGQANRGLRDPVLSRILAALQTLEALDYREYKKNSDRRRLACAPRLTEAFSRLSIEEKKRILTLEQNSEGITPLDLLIAAKRSFVSEVFDVIQPRDWLRNVEQCHGVRLRARALE